MFIQMQSLAPRRFWEFMTTYNYDHVEVYYWGPEDPEFLPTYAISYKSVNVPWPATHLRADRDKLKFPVKKVSQLPEELICDPMKDEIAAGKWTKIVYLWYNEMSILPECKMAWNKPEPKKDEPKKEEEEPKEEAKPADEPEPTADDEDDDCVIVE